MTRPLRVLVACEYSDTVSRHFRARGHDVTSCDLLPTEGVGDGMKHVVGDVRYLLRDPWDLLIGHPPCTDLAVSGARWFDVKPGKREAQQAGLDFFARLWSAPVRFIALENPISVISTWIAKPAQVIQPHHYGHPEFKATCLWLKGLPNLTPTKPLPVPAKGTDTWKTWNVVHRAPPGEDRWKDRSRTYTGIASAMADQWGSYVSARVKQ